MTWRIGVDLGGTKTEVAALDDSGEIRWRRRAPTAGEYGAIVTNIGDLVRAAETELGVHATVGVGIPGVVSPVTGLVKNANSLVLIGHPLDKDLGAALDREVRVENDANCFAL
ncbi:MAG: ROK family protein, partial [Acetobacteraceae bacterium]|nr:ROK family protein [Acetobacteraceae bacterium]